MKRIIFALLISFFASQVFAAALNGACNTTNNRCASGLTCVIPPGSAAGVCKLNEGARCTTNRDSDCAPLNCSRYGNNGQGCLGQPGTCQCTRPDN